MTPAALFTVAVVLLMLVVLVLEVIEADVVVYSALGVLLLSGIITPTEALEGFANKGMMTVAILFIVAYAAQTSGVIQIFADRIMGNGKGMRRSLLRMMAPLMLLSAFLNNTPIVAMFTPYIRDWALRNRHSPSRFLIPMTYAVTFGGLFTLIGTSTTLVVNGLYQKAHGSGIGMFEIGYIGIPCGIAAAAFVILFGYRLLPDHRDLESDLAAAGREYLVELEVLPSSPLVGKTVAEAGLRNLENIFLAEIFRNGDSIVPVRPTDHLRAGDRLVFTGMVAAIVQLHSMPGLVPCHGNDLYQALRSRKGGRVVEAVVSRSSPMLGKTIKEGNFRARYDAAVLAIHRHGERLETKIGQTVLRAGDTLLLLAGDDFHKRWNQARDFYLISTITELPPLNRKRTALSFLSILGMVALSAFGVMDIFQAAILASVLLLVTRTVTAVEARRSLELNVIIVIAASLGIGRALEKTGAASYLAGKIIAGVDGCGVLGALAAVFLVTTLVTEAVTNNAAAAVVFPIAMAAAAKLGADPKPFAIAVAVAASASFATTIGYQTNLMVSGPGRYRARDFLKIGIPVKLIYLAVTLAAAPLLWRM